MHLTHLSLANFRNYAKQELDLAPGTILLLGENAQGKTNLLEAVALLATGRSERADSDADFIAWDAREETQPVARIVAHALRASGEVSVELTVAGKTGVRGNLLGAKRFKLNGVARRAADVTGAILAVLFTTDDMDLVKGGPAGRRRYLDVMLAQVDRPYARALQQYTKLVTQRNALLKRIQERSARPSELSYWDTELSTHGGTLLLLRAQAVGALSAHAAAAHARLSGDREVFALAYAPRFVAEWPPERIAAGPEQDVAAALLARFEETHDRDIGAGVTLAGPHRDDLEMTIGGEPASSFASRGQQRTAALALRLAEARYITERSGEQPVLLLDDVLSELDESRRASVLGAIEADQVWITSADADRFSKKFTAAAQCWRVEDGAATPV
ncbi:MAG: DNA replication/repair protein RecF [Dehalococcoidia bacterium]